MISPSHGGGPRQAFTLTSKAWGIRILDESPGRLIIIMETTQIFVLLYLLLFLSYMAVKIITFSFKNRLNPATFLKRKDGERSAWIGLSITLILEMANIIFFVFASQPTTNFFSSAGIFISSVGFLLVIIAHHQMGKSWRIGTDNKSKKLVLSGLFHYSRNPVYLGLLIAGIGLFLVMQNLLSFLLIIALYIFLRLIISYEEDFLQEHFGKEYQIYLRRVRRFF